MPSDLAEIKERDETPNPIRMLLSLELAGDVVMHKRCSLCNSVHRKGVEEMYDNGKSFLDMQKYLEERGESIAPPNIRHHLKDHYKNLERISFMLDYCDRYDELASKRRRREDDLQSLVDTAMLELARVIAIDTKSDIHKEKVRSDMLLKTISSIRESLESRNDMEDSGSAIRTLEINFANAWKSCMEKAPDDQKKLFATALKEFKKQLG